MRGTWNDSVPWYLIILNMPFKSEPLFKRVLGLPACGHRKSEKGRTPFHKYLLTFIPIGTLLAVMRMNVSLGNHRCEF